MGLQLSLGKKKKQQYPYPPGYPVMPMPYGGVNPYWPGGPYGPVAVVPGNYPQGFIPPTLPWPAPQPTYGNRKRKRKSTSAKRQNRGGPDPMSNFPAGFVPSGFVPRSEGQTRMPQPVIPTSISRATSQGQPPPLFTPGNGTQPLTGFPSPQIPIGHAGGGGGGGGGGSSHGHGSNLRAPTPFIRSQPDDDDDDETDDEIDGDGPVIPDLSRGGHRRAATMPTNYYQIQPYIPPQRHNNPLPRPPLAFERTPFKRLDQLPQLEVPTHTAVVQMVQPEAGLAGIGANGAGGTQKKKSRIMRALSLRGNKQSDSSKSGTAQGPTMAITRLVPVVVSSLPGGGAAGPSSSAGPPPQGNPVVPPNPNAATTNPPNTTQTASPNNFSTQSPPPEPPVRFDAKGQYRPFVPFSEHPVVYNGKEYPTAQHLYEARRFPSERPDLREKIRNLRGLADVYATSAQLCQQRLDIPNWVEICPQVMEEVLWLKLMQHEPIRRQLLATGNVPLVFCAKDSFWGNDEEGGGNGQNQLGHLLVRLRDRLRAEGFDS